jgi:hypothetical protein
MSDRFKDILSSVNENVSDAAQKRHEIKNVKACDMMTNEDYSEEEDDPMEIEIEMLKKEIELEMLKQKLMEIKKSKAQDGDFTKIEEMEVEDPEMEMMEYKNDFYQMSLGSIKSIATHANVILQALDNPSVQESLTESWLQGKIAVTEDYMITIHNFVMFGRSETDTEGSEAEAKKKVKIKDLPHYQYQNKDYPGVTTHEDTMSKENKPGLWENIRKKKEKEGKKYRPAKPGNPDRPDPKQWKKLTK